MISVFVMPLAPLANLNILSTAISLLSDRTKYYKSVTLYKKGDVMFYETALSYVESRFGMLISNKPTFKLEDLSRFWLVLAYSVTLFIILHGIEHSGSLDGLSLLCPIVLRRTRV